ncbi:aspartate/glutamate racemase family protein [Tenacibaculum ovolyticum]|uniref:aspartate/glutamate racemase family protein n=1 Tax=Tenacibaculum ovolyticum TaxID=104270 RepID=UPI001EED8A18|nr:amino acid racemase [Tenacibaculum ovolyticum]
MKKVGLVGGVSWTSTLDYYQLINEGINERLGGLNAAECVIYSLNFADVQEQTWENAFELLFQACLTLKRSNVEAIVLCANTAHMFADKIEEQVGLPIINIITATAKAINSKDISKVALLGTKFTMEMDFYKDKLEGYGLNIMIPNTQEDRDIIQHIVKEELGKGKLKKESKETFISISKKLINDGAEGIILGCTEIPLLIGQEDFSIPVLDTTKIHSEAIINYILN